MACSIGQEDLCDKTMCQFALITGNFCKARGGGKSKLFVHNKKKTEFAATKQQLQIKKTFEFSNNTVYIWAGKLGIEILKSKGQKPIDKNAKFLGYTNSIGYPKTLHNGRIIYKDEKKYY